MKDSEQTIQIFNQHAIHAGTKIRVFGQFRSPISKRQIQSIRLVSAPGVKIRPKIKVYSKRNDFYFELPESFQGQAFGINLGTEVVFDTIRFEAPFGPLACDRSAVIASTMIQNYSHRLIEWIHYHLKLGFSRIILFDNNSDDDTHEKIKRLNDSRVIHIPFNYGTFPGYTFEEIQRITLSIALNAYKKECHWICYTDADEFIQIPDIKPMRIDAYLNNRKFQRYKAVTMQSILLTNKANQESIDNNVLDLCRFSDDKPAYTKIILNTQKNKRTHFLKSPHRIRGEFLPPSQEIYHGHFWANERLSYHAGMTENSQFLAFKLEEM